MTLWRSRSRGDGLSENPALDPAFQSGERGATDDCCRLHVFFLVPSGTNFHLELSHAVHTRLRKY